MLTISKPLGAAQTKQYYQEDYAHAETGYYTGDGAAEADARLTQGEWSGKLAVTLGLHGAVESEQFERLADGQHPFTSVAFLRTATPHTSTNRYGETIQTKGARAGFDATFSAPKSVSLAALIGGDERLKDAHRLAVETALAELEQYTQARLGNTKGSLNTGQFIAAKFEHELARPDHETGYAAPQLHTHVVIFNLTQTPQGKWRALQPLELYRSQQFATAIYRTVLAEEAQKLGYEIQVDRRTGAPELKGFTAAYLAAQSPRRQEVQAGAAALKARLAAEGLNVKEGAGLQQAAATLQRRGKDFDPAVMRQRQQALEEKYGAPSHTVVTQARTRAQQHAYQPDPNELARRAREAVTFARDHVLEREAVADYRQFLTEALRRNMGLITFRSVQVEIAERRAKGELVDLFQPRRAPTLTSRRMLGMESENIRAVLAGQGAQASLTPLEQAPQRIQTAEAKHGLSLNANQREAVTQLLANEDRIVALQGKAGTGKTTTMTILREAVEHSGYSVRGIAPTHKARKELEKSGIRTQTLHSFVREQATMLEGEKRLYVLDEASLADTRRMQTLFRQLQPTDRLLLVGDRAQHQAIEAGAPFAQFQQRGVTTVWLTENVRQQNPTYRRTVEQVSRGEIREAVESLKAQGRVIEIADDLKRLNAIAREFVTQQARPGETLVISPANAQRIALNTLIHRELQRAGKVDTADHSFTVLANRSTMTGAERGFAGAYQPRDVIAGEAGDLIRYSRRSVKYGVGKGDYARVLAVDFAANTLTVQFAEGRELTYDPRRLQGVSVYAEAQRNFAIGDRVQFRATLEKDLTGGPQVANGELGTIQKIHGQRLEILTEAQRLVTVDLARFRHLDHGYAVTSHSAQGQTVDRVIVHADTREGVGLLNRRMAYVALSRARQEGMIFTNDADKLAAALERKIDKTVALEEQRRAARFQPKRAERAADQQESRRDTGFQFGW